MWVLGPFSPLVLIPHHTFILIANTLIDDTLVLTTIYDEHTLHLNGLALLPLLHYFDCN